MLVEQTGQRGAGLHFSNFSTLVYYMKITTCAHHKEVVQQIQKDEAPTQRLQHFKSQS